MYQMIAMLKKYLGNKFILILLALTGLSNLSYGASEEAVVNDLGDRLMVIFIISVLIVIISVLLFMLYVMGSFIKVLKSEGGLSASAASVKIFDMTDAVPIEREHEILLDHNYDGIMELDNNLPPWWKYMFYLTIVFAVIYMAYYHVYDGALMEDEYQQELVVAEIQMKQAAGRVDENSVKLLTDAAKLESGKEIYKQNCVACHGQQGEGIVGPNLTDEYWIHGGDIKAVFKTVKYGVPQKMIAWQSQLSPPQIQEVSSYVLSLQGSNPANGKAKEGELYTP